MILYNCKRSTDRDETYILTKFDDDMNIESSYNTSLTECECPAGSRNTCRHRQMLPQFLAYGYEDTENFFCYDDQTWHQPFTESDNEELEASTDRRSADEAHRHAISLDGAFESGAIKIVEAEASGSRPSASVGEVEPVVPSPTTTPIRINRRL